jgi:hypothetical protein
MTLVDISGSLTIRPCVIIASPHRIDDESVGVNKTHEALDTSLI